MKNVFFIFFLVAVTKGMSQTADVSISYALREVQIDLAKKYNKELSSTLKKVSEYYALNLGAYQATRIRGNRESSFMYSFPSDPCSGYKNWGPLKFNRCRKKIALLKVADKLVRDIPSTSTSYSDISTVNSRITFRASSILRDINKELLKNY